jgi:hypothetical protein
LDITSERIFQENPYPVSELSNAATSRLRVARVRSATYREIGHLRVNRGDAFEKGGPIAAMRSSGDSPGALRFELRRGARLIDAPLHRRV